MVVTSLTSHVSRKKNSEIQISQSSNNETELFVKFNENPASKESQKSKRTVGSILVPVSTLRTEVFLTFKVESSPFSLRSCLGFNKLFRSMFTDSKIVKSFGLSKNKCGYIMNFGLAPYFKDLLLQGIKASDCFIVSYDESINKSIARGANGCADWLLE